ncbi:DUF6694 family lipoprotein [Pseudoxanthomonas sp.]|uniref:DUF6694 family lipoprotein n=1 Tax=Pseudoxanthomonas sp. TaxID=1871049 RepID=UPI00260DDE32|nr:DUF6694 family lipoprotein [Pseudoxanthomonas sp.]WDS37991.1 MAG: hypothetical protein O8I58_09095 [Pseudoxanthomonas sp.]
MKIRRTWAVLCLAAIVGVAQAREPVRIDASSEQAANNSFKKMMKALPQNKQSALAAAILQLNLAGVNSAYDVVGNPSLQSLSAGRIKDRIAGFSADEIITLSQAAPDVTTKVEIQETPALAPPPAI